MPLHPPVNFSTRTTGTSTTPIWKISTNSRNKPLLKTHNIPFSMKFLFLQPFSVSKKAVSGSSGGLYCGYSHGLAWLVDRGGSLALELGSRLGLLEQIAPLEPCTERVAPIQLELQNMPGRYSRLFSQRQCLRRNNWAHLLLQESSSILESRRRVDSSHWTQAIRIARHWLRHRQRFTTVSRLEAILAATRMVIWMTRKKELYEVANFLHCDMTLPFKNQLRINIR